MAKLALINREAKRARLVAKFAAKRAALVALVEDSKLSDEERMAARLALQQLPRNANPTRQRNRCVLTGRPRGVFRKFGLCRNKLREIAFRGEVPGMTKASWYGEFEDEYVRSHRRHADAHPQWPTGSEGIGLDAFIEAEGGNREGAAG